MCKPVEIISDHSPSRTRTAYRRRNRSTGHKNSISRRHHNALLYDAERKKRRRLRKTKRTLLLDRSLIDLIDNVGPSDMNDTEHEEHENEIDIDPSNSNEAHHHFRESSVDFDHESDHKEEEEL